MPQHETQLARGGSRLGGERHSRCTRAAIRESKDVPGGARELRACRVVVRDPGGPDVTSDVITPRALALSFELPIRSRRALRGVPVSMRRIGPRRARSVARALGPSASRAELIPRSSNADSCGLRKACEQLSPSSSALGLCRVGSAPSNRVPGCQRSAGRATRLGRRRARSVARTADENACRAELIPIRSAADSCRLGEPSSSCCVVVCVRVAAGPSWHD